MLEDGEERQRLAEAGSLRRVAGLHVAAHTADRDRLAVVPQGRRRTCRRRRGDPCREAAGPVPPLRPRHRADRRGHDQHRHRARRPGPRAARRHLAAVVPAPPRSSRAGRARSCATRTPTGAASPASTRSPPTSATSRPGPPAFAGFTVLSTAMGLARPAGAPGPTRCWPCRRRSRWAAPAGWPPAAGGVPFVFNIQDVFPDVAVELGAITNPRVIQLASWLERWSYRRSDAVTVLSDDLRDNLVAKIRGTVPDAHDRIRVIPNFVDTDRITPRDPDGGHLPRRVRARRQAGGDVRRQRGVLAVARPGAGGRPHGGRAAGHGATWPS